MKKLFILFTILLLLAGCKAYQQEVRPSRAPAGSAPKQSIPRMMNVAIQDFSFNPGTIRIKAGETVVWTNNDGTPHTVTAVSGPEMFDSGRLGKGRSFSQAFKTPGTYKYQCNIHPSMRGTVIVE